MEYNESIESRLDGTLDRVGAIFEGLQARKEELATRSQRRAQAALEPGQVVPSWGRDQIVTDDCMEEFKGARTAAAEELRGVFASLAQGLDGRMAQPPAAADLAAVQASLGRSNLTLRELQALRDHYEDSYQLTRLIDEAAWQRFHVAIGGASESALADNAEAACERAVGMLYSGTSPRVARSQALYDLMGGRMSARDQLYYLFGADAE